MFALSPSNIIMTTLSPELQAAYEATQFVVDGAHVIRMREPLPAALAAWLRSHDTALLEHFLAQSIRSRSRNQLKKMIDVMHC